MANMSKLNKTVSVQVNPCFTANDWQLYTASMNCDEAANALNEAVAHAINSGMIRRDAAKYVWKVMDQYSRYGAYDTEPCVLLEYILDDVYAS